jgi:hydrogenase-4 component E
MSGSTFSSVLTLAVGAVLVSAVIVVWLSSVRLVIRVVAVQGMALGLVVLTLGLHLDDGGLIATAAVVLAVKGIAIPSLLDRAGGRAPTREIRPLVNIPASLVASAVLIVLAFVATRGVAHFVGGTAGGLVPVGMATALLGFFVLVGRRRPIFQMVGLLMIDNGIAMMAFLCTAGVPFLVEMGVSLDVLLGVVVLMVLAQRLRSEFDDLDVDELQDLHD